MRRYWKKELSRTEKDILLLLHKASDLFDKIFLTIQAKRLAHVILAHGEAASMMIRKSSIKLLGVGTVTVLSAMTMIASAQANYVLLLNGASVNSLTITIEMLSTEIPNGLPFDQKVKCSGGLGSMKMEVKEGGLKVPGALKATLTGCAWVGFEKSCTINDGGAGKIQIATGFEMSGSSIVGYTPELTTLLTEGAFCFIPEEEVIGGLLAMDISEAETSMAVHSFAMEAGVSILKGEGHLRDSDPNASFAFH
jgi:hypothetical protein